MGDINNKEDKYSIFMETLTYKMLARALGADPFEAWLVAEIDTSEINSERYIALKDAREAYYAYKKK